MTNILNTRIFNIEAELNLSIKAAAERRAYDEVATLIADHANVTSGDVKTRRLAAFTYGLEDPKAFAEEVRAVAKKLVNSTRDLNLDDFAASAFYYGISKCFSRIEDGDPIPALGVLIDLEGISAVAQAFEFARGDLSIAGTVSI